MSVWQGAEGKYSAEGLPHVTEIARKPEGVGAEMKALADGESNIMLRLDIMEGKDRQREKPFVDVGSEGTAITLRLSEPYFGSGRVIHADSAFSSVRTCLELRKHGPITKKVKKDYFVGRNNTKEYHGESPKL